MVWSLVSLSILLFFFFFKQKTAYEIHFSGLRNVQEPQRQVVLALLAASAPGKDTDLRTVTASLVLYPNATQAIGTPGVSAGVRDDIYTILTAYDTNALSWATIRVLVIPLVSWLWVGGLVVGIGAVVAALPQPKRRAAAVLVRETRVSVEA